MGATASHPNYKMVLRIQNRLLVCSLQALPPDSSQVSLHLLAQPPLTRMQPIMSQILRVVSNSPLRLSYALVVDYWFSSSKCYSLELVYKHSHPRKIRIGAANKVFKSLVKAPQEMEQQAAPQLEHCDSQYYYSSHRSHRMLFVIITLIGQVWQTNACPLRR